MAVGAHDVALSGLSAEFPYRHQHGSTRGEVEELGARIPMIEIHLIGLESAAAVGARHVSPLPQHFDGSGLANLDSVSLDIAVPSVVIDVCRALIADPYH